MTMVRKLTKLLKSAKRISDIIIATCNVDCNVVDIGGADVVMTDFCKMCTSEQRNSLNTQKCPGVSVRNVYNSDRWGGKYEFCCPLGCAFICTSMTAGTEVECGVLVGPFLLTEREDFLENDAHSFFKGRHSRGFAFAVQDVPYKDYNDVPYLSDMVFMLSSYLSEREILDQRLLELTGQYNNEVYDTMLRMKNENEVVPYPIEIEKMLQMYIAGGDRQSAQTALNDILAHIYFTSGDLEVMKVRVTELTVLLSRAAIAGGASIGEVFGLNTDYFSQINALKTQDQLNNCLYHALMRFTSCVFKVDDTKHSEIIRKIMEYISKHRSEKITLNDISYYVNFSVSYISRIFKEETGENLSAYINKVRIEHARVLLLNPNYSLVEVATMSGYEDQSYFNKVFKKICGYTPGKFREKHGKTP